MATIVGIFDNARDLDKAVERLARAGFEDTIYDESIVAGEGGVLGVCDLVSAASCGTALSAEVRYFESVKKPKASSIFRHLMA